MTTTPLDTRTRVLGTARDAVAARMRADVALLVAAADWAVMHPATDVTGYAGFGEDVLFGEALVPLAGPGAPMVAEFAPAELAATLGWSTETVKVLMGDALELVHRLPRLFEHVTQLRVPVWIARHAATQTRDLDPDAAHDADRMLACHPSSLTRRIVKRVVDEVRLRSRQHPTGRRTRPTRPIADFVRLRDPQCVFPGCPRPSRRCDLDHIKPYVPPDDGGPPGQTHPDNLAPLCRHHHRVKTHGRFRYWRLPDGSYRWTTPSGRTISVPPQRRR